MRPSNPVRVGDPVGIHVSIPVRVGDPVRIHVSSHVRVGTLYEFVLSSL